MVMGAGEEQTGQTGPSEMKTLADKRSNDEMESDLVEENIVDMATAVALEMEAEDLQREAERSELSLDELTTLRQLEAKLGHALGQTEGPMIPEVGFSITLDGPCQK